MRRLLLLVATALPLLAQLAVENTTVIDPRSGAVLPDHTVLIDGTQITRVGPSTAVPRPAGYRRVDGRGRFLIPGLWDTHVHLTKAGETSLALFLANGITSVRDMGSDHIEVLQWRSEIAQGRRIGPRIWTSGRILEARSNVERMKREGGVEPVDRIRIGVATPAEARTAVAELARTGVQHIKVRTVASPEVLAAIAAAARAAGLPLTGHAPPGKPDAYLGLLTNVEHAVAVPPLDQLSAPERQAFFGRLHAAGTWVGTTLVNFDGSILIPYARATQLMADSAGKLDPRRRYIGGYLLRDWHEQVEERRAAEQEYVAVVRRMKPGLVRDIRDAHAAGVPLLAGTDVGVAFIYPGFSLHDELALLVRETGLTPLQALRIATDHPARFYGLQREQGAIAAGQRADLVLLAANPLADIAHTTRITSVIAGGTLWTRRQLDALLRQTAARVHSERESRH